MNMSLLPKNNPDAKRQHEFALAKVYNLLLELAEKAESQKSLTDMPVEENTTKSDSIPQNILP